MPACRSMMRIARSAVAGGSRFATDNGYLLQQLAELDTIDYPVSEGCFCRQRRHSRREIPLFMRDLARRKIYTRKPQKWYRTGSRMQNGMSRRRIWRPETTGRDPAAHDSGSECETLYRVIFPLIRPPWSS